MNNTHPCPQVLKETTVPMDTWTGNQMITDYNGAKPQT